MPLPLPDPRPEPLPLPMETPTVGALGIPMLGMLEAILRSFWTSMVGTTAILGCSSGGALGGTSWTGSNLGGLPLLTGAGPRWPPPPPMRTALGGAIGGGAWISTVAICLGGWTNFMMRLWKYQSRPMTMA